MSLLWLVPAAAWGLVALAAPLLVHLLTRQERRPLVFPSLRFLVATRLVARRQRRVQDWLLLAVRAAIVAVAVAALAAPLLITPWRERAWNARVARAIVEVRSDGGEQLAADEVQGDEERDAAVDSAGESADERAHGAFSARIFSGPPPLAGVLRDAVAWLDTQPPAAREVVIAGDLRAGDLQDSDLAAIPTFVGVRFLAATADPVVRDITLPVLTRDAGGAVMEDRQARLDPDVTRVRARATQGAGAAKPGTPASHRLEVRAPAEQMAAAEAALAAALDTGIVAGAPDARHVIVVWPDAGVDVDADLDGGAGSALPAGWMRRVAERFGVDAGLVDGALVVRLADAPAGADAVHRLHDIAAEAFGGDVPPREPERIPAADMARWSRPPGGAPADAPMQDEGDRRALWALALGLLVVEAIMRRRGGRRVETVADEPDTAGGARVA